MKSSRFSSLPIWVCAFVVAFASACEEPKKIDPPVDEAPWGEKKRLDEKQSPGTGPIQIGAAVRVIDGPVGTSMAGFGGRARGRRTHWADKLKGAAGFYGMQTTKVVAIEVGGEKMALVKSPLMSGSAYLTDAIARALDRDYDLDFKGRIIVMAGHSHHTTARYWPLPELLGHVGADSFDYEVAENNAAIFASAIAEAWESREPGEWGYAFKEDWDPNDEVYRDRRGVNNPTYGKDPRLTILGFRKKSDATPLAVLINFPVHGIALDTANDMFSEDVPGHVEHKFEELFFATKGVPVFGMFSQSAGGDASPGGDSKKHPDLARMEKIGEVAARKILAVYDTLEWQSETELAIRSQRIELIHDRIYKGRPWEDEFHSTSGTPYTYGGWQCFARDGNMEGQPKYCVDLETFLPMMESEVPHDAAHQTYITTARLGDLWLLTVPGEPAYSVVKYARDEAAKRTWNGKPLDVVVLGYAQDHLLYLTSPDDWYLGGYESEMSLWGPGGGVFLIDEGLSLADSMMDGFNGPTFYEDSPGLTPVIDWEPRARERSLAPGDVVEQPEAVVARTETARFAANCGDPALGNPYVRVQRQAAGGFENIPALHGWPGRFYDNSRYEMVTVYDPDPPPKRDISEPERTHTWRFLWQVPLNWPAGTYRFSLSCYVLPVGSKEPEALVIDSTPFSVTMPEGAQLSASVLGSNLQVSLRLPGVEQTMFKSESPKTGEWYDGGYRLLDPGVDHTEPALVREALRVEVLDATDAVVETLTAAFDEEAGANVTQLEKAFPSNAKLRVWFESDHAPSPVTVTMSE